MTRYDPGEPMRAWAEGWIQFWTLLAEGVADTQRATAAALGQPWAEPVGGGVEPAADEVAGRMAAALPSMTYRHEDWTFERSVDAFDEIGVGDTVSFGKRVTDADVRAFARASGDTNRLHLDDAFARGTRFGERIAHGTLVAGLVSAALARLPGLTIYLSQDTRYLHPVTTGESVTADCEVVEDLGGGRYRLVTTVTDESGRTVVDGEAVVLIDDLPPEGDAG